MYCLDPSYDIPYIMNEGLILDANGEFVKTFLPSDPLPLPFPTGSVGSLVYPDGSGTAFVVETLDNGGNQNNPIAIVATAAHVYYTAFSGTKNQYKWLFTFDEIIDEYYYSGLEFLDSDIKLFKEKLKGFEAYLAEPIEKQLSWCDTPQKDPVSANRIVLKNDFMFFKIYNKSPFSIPISKPKRKRIKFRKLNCYLDCPVELEEKKIKSEESKSSGQSFECFLIGRPGTIKMGTFLKVCPNAGNKSITDAQSALHRGNRLVVSKGEIRAIDELIAASASSYFGMSGGPLCIIRNQQWNVIGLMTSSPPTMFHFPYHAIIANITYMYMDMDRLFDFLDCELSFYKEWKKWISVIAKKKARKTIDNFKSYMSNRHNEEVGRGYREDGLDMSYNLFFPLWNTDIRSEMISLRDSYPVIDSIPKKRKCRIF